MQNPKQEKSTNQTGKNRLQNIINQIKFTWHLQKTSMLRRAALRIERMVELKKQCLIN